MNLSKIFFIFGLWFFFHGYSMASWISSSGENTPNRNTRLLTENENRVCEKVCQTPSAVRAQKRKRYLDKTLKRPLKKDIFRMIRAHPTLEENLVRGLFLSSTGPHTPSQKRIRDAGLDVDGTLKKRRLALSEPGSSPLRREKALWSQSKGHLLSPFTPKGVGMRIPMMQIATKCRKSLVLEEEKISQIRTQQARQEAASLGKKLFEARKHQLLGKTRSKTFENTHKKGALGCDPLMKDFIQWLNSTPQVTPCAMITEFYANIAPYCIRMTSPTQEVGDFYFHPKDIDLKQKDISGRCNQERLRQGKNPYGLDGKVMEWHHLTQDDTGPIVLITKKRHAAKGLHPFQDSESLIDRTTFNRVRKDMNQKLIVFLHDLKKNNFFQTTFI